MSDINFIMLTDSEASNLFKLTSSKKREAIAALNHYNAITGEYVNNYQKVCDEIAFNIKKRLHFSKHRHLIVLNFFKDFKLSANADYKFNLKLKELDDKEKKADIGNKTNETLIDTGISLFYNDLKFFVDGANKLQHGAENEIMGRILKDTIKKLDIQIKDLLEKSKKNYATLERKGQSVAKRLAEFNRSFNVSIKDNDIGKRCVVDTTDGLITYRNRVQTLTSSLAIYGKQVLEYREMAIELNHKQNECLKDALVEFTRMVGEFVGDVNNTRFSRSLSHLNAINLEPNKADYFDIIKLITNKQELESILFGAAPTTKDIIDAIYNLKVQPLEPLYDLFSRKYYEFSDSYKNPVDSVLFITLDFFFVAYKKNKNNGLEKIISLPIENIILVLDDVNQIIKCSYKTKGIFWDTTKTLKISMKREYMDELLLSYDFATNMVKDLNVLSPASSLKQITDELGQTDENHPNTDPNNANDGGKDKRDELLDSYLEENDINDGQLYGNSGSDKILPTDDGNNNGDDFGKQPNMSYCDYKAVIADSYIGEEYKKYNDHGDDEVTKNNDASEDKHKNNEKIEVKEDS